jgi:hypothetical protein
MARRPEISPPVGGESALGSTLAIDRFVPCYDFVVVHAGVFPSPQERSYRAARDLNLLKDPVIVDSRGRYRRCHGSLRGAGTARTGTRKETAVKLPAGAVSTPDPGLPTAGFGVTSAAMTGPLSAVVRG